MVAKVKILSPFPKWREEINATLDALDPPASGEGEVVQILGWAQSSLCCRVCQGCLSFLSEKLIYTGIFSVYSLQLGKLTKNSLPSGDMKVCPPEPLLRILHP